MKVLFKHSFCSLKWTAGFLLKTHPTDKAPSGLIESPITFIAGIYMQPCFELKAYQNDNRNRFWSKYMESV